MPSVTYKPLCHLKPKEYSSLSLCSPPALTCPTQPNLNLLLWPDTYSHQSQMIFAGNRLLKTTFSSASAGLLAFNNVIHKF